MVTVIILDTSVRTHVSVELVVLCREDHLPEVFADPGDPGEVDAVVVEAQELVDHGLVGPLQDKAQARPPLQTGLPNQPHQWWRGGSPGGAEE